MTKKAKIGTCALCGRTVQVTREHVPPKNLFLPPRPRNTITVPLCEGCNHSYHLDDEYFRVYVAAGAEPGTRLWRLWQDKVVGSSFARSGGLKGRLNDDRALLAAHNKREHLLTFDGDVLGDEQLPCVQSFDALRINALVEKIVRCLHFSHTGDLLSPALPLVVEVTPLTKSEEEDLYSRRTGFVGHHDDFVFRQELLGQSAFRWLLGFYRYHTFTVRGNAS